MFDTLLIANRGEIACRIARTARRMGLRTVAVYSDADAHALHVQACDEAYRIGPPAPRDSYLRGDVILDVARRCGAQALHPGYGFLSENEAFAAACAATDVVFVGPPPSAIAAMGSKSAAKRIMAQAGVPLVPGYHEDDQDPARLAREAAHIGYPVLIKATAGGGGKGMKIAERAADFPAALASAQREARASFGDDRVLVEKYLVAPRHIEIQVFADTHGHALHLFERDCSVQRRHQKVLEEATAPGMGAATRQAMGDAALAAARAIGYVGAGTVEFIVPASFARDGTFYFMEMNTRLQVEHPVTEMVTGLDLVEWQLRVAAGEPLPRSQDGVRADGHAIEARLYAEDPGRGFLPSIGRIVHWRMPVASDRVRVDTGFRTGDEVSPYYDPMLAKLIVWGEDRERARAQMLHALRACEVAGVATNLDLLERIVAHPDFAAGRLDTGLIERHRDALLGVAAHAPDAAFMAAAFADYVALRKARRAEAAQSADPWSPWAATDAWWNGSAQRAVMLDFADGASVRTIAVEPQQDGSAVLRDGPRTAGARLAVHGERVHLDMTDGPSDDYAVVHAGAVLHVFGNGVRTALTRVDRLAHAGEAPAHAGHLMAPMSGTIVAVLVKPGDTVAQGAPLVILEAMKMEHTIAAPAAGIVEAIHCAVGERVAEGIDLVDLADAPA
ncbi:MAG TPA: acetyl/propionyl/methylcrotonyl-CoA carboxylase subunit alpha [Casimicrobiaceae bacterium]|nr:acetyl/propionyl/methylcrotonyl-CoA carboxylase subunit alpha [Casimicrobiaceae bacterium]